MDKKDLKKLTKCKGVHQKVEVNKKPPSKKNIYKYYSTKQLTSLKCQVTEFITKEESMSLSCPLSPACFIILKAA
jgi:hypothetical protein